MSQRERERGGCVYVYVCMHACLYVCVKKTRDQCHKPFPNPQIFWHPLSAVINLLNNGRGQVNSQMLHKSELISEKASMKAGQVKEKGREINTTGLYTG